MKAKGLLYEQETTIVWNRDEKMAVIWTANGSVYRKLLKEGYKPVEDRAHSARFHIPASEIRLPKPKSAARSAAAKARFAEKGAL